MNHNAHGRPDPALPGLGVATAPYRLHVARALGLSAILLGTGALLGWAGTIQVGSPNWPDLTTTQTLSAATFVLAGVALILTTIAPPLGTVPAALVVLIATCFLAQYATIPGPIAGSFNSTQPSALTAAGLLVFAAALLLLRWRSHPRVALAIQIALGIGLLLSGVALIEHFVVTSSPAFTAGLARMTLPATAGLLALFVGVLVLSQEHAWLRPLLERGEAGVFARRLMPAIILGPVLVDWLTLRGADAGLYPTELVPPLGTLIDTTLLAGLVLWATTGLAHATHHRAELLATLDHSAVLVRDCDGVIRYWSAGCERLYGIPTVTAVGHRMHELLRTEFPRPLAEIRTELERAGEWLGDLRHRCPGGRLITVASHWTLRRDAQGHPVAIVEANTDITALHAAREATARAEAEFRASFENAAVGKLQAEPISGRILRVNRAFARTLGHDDPAALVGTFFWDLIEPDRCAMDRATFSQLLSGETDVFLRETQQLRRDGTAVWVRISATLLRDATTNAPLRMLAVVEDIEARRRAEQELHDVAARFRRIFEDSPIGIVVSDATSGQLLAVNPAFCRMLNYTSDELVGRTRDVIVHPDDKAIPTLLHQVPGQELTAHERRYVSKSGQTVLARVRVAPLDLPEARQHLLLCLAEDITALRETEAELRHALRLETIGRLTGGVAHDFNNMLGVIIGNVEILLEGLQSDSDQAELASAILDTALGGAELTRRLLAFARRQSLQPTVFDLNAAVSGHVRLLQRTLGEQVHVVTSLSAGLRRVLADPSQTGDALLNLAINARDAMPSGGQLTIATANARLEATADIDDTGIVPGDYVTLSVTDTGLGMPPEVLERAMTPFFTTKPPGTGSGLGLSMIYGYAKQSGGHLRIDSEIGVGTTVKLYLPTAPKAAELTLDRPPAQSVLPGGNEKVLLVDDNAEMRNVAARHLLALGYGVRMTDSAASALAILRGGERFDLLFTDVVMPGVMTGDDLAEAAQAHQPDLAVLFTTGYAGVQEGDGALGHSLPGLVIRKPYRRAELAAKVRMALNGQSPHLARGAGEVTSLPLHPPATRPTQRAWPPQPRP